MHARNLKRKPKAKPATAAPRSPVTAPSSSRTGTKVLGSRKTVQATQAKNLFGAILKSAREVGPVFIERHGQTQAVLLDFGTYQKLVSEKRSPDERQLDVLRAQFDDLYARMQKPAARAVADRFLSASAEELNKVARRVRKRG